MLELEPPMLEVEPPMLEVEPPMLEPTPSEAGDSSERTLLEMFLESDASTLDNKPLAFDSASSDTFTF